MSLNQPDAAQKPVAQDSKVEGEKAEAGTEEAGTQQNERFGGFWRRRAVSLNQSDATQKPVVLDSKVEGEKAEAGTEEASTQQNERFGGFWRHRAVSPNQPDSAQKPIAQDSKVKGEKTEARTEEAGTQQNERFGGFWGRRSVSLNQSDATQKPVVLDSKVEGEKAAAGTEEAGTQQNERFGRFWRHSAVSPSQPDATQKPVEGQDSKVEGEKAAAGTEEASTQQNERFGGFWRHRAVSPNQPDATQKPVEGQDSKVEGEKAEARTEEAGTQRNERFGGFWRHRAVSRNQPDSAQKPIAQDSKVEGEKAAAGTEEAGTQENERFGGFRRRRAVSLNQPDATQKPVVLDSKVEGEKAAAGTEEAGTQQSERFGGFRRRRAVSPNQPDAAEKPVEGLDSRVEGEKAEARTREARTEEARAQQAGRPAALWRQRAVPPKQPDAAEKPVEEQDSKFEGEKAEARTEDARTEEARAQQAGLPAALWRQRAALPKEPDSAQKPVAQDSKTEGEKAEAGTVEDGPQQSESAGTGWRRRALLPKLRDVESRIREQKSLKAERSDGNSAPQVSIGLSRMLNRLGEETAGRDSRGGGQPPRAEIRQATPSSPGSATSSRQFAEKDAPDVRSVAKGVEKPAEGTPSLASGAESKPERGDKQKEGHTGLEQDGDLRKVASVVAAGSLGEAVGRYVQAYSARKTSEQNPPAQGAAEPPPRSSGPDSQEARDRASTTRLNPPPEADQPGVWDRQEPGQEPGKAWEGMWTEREFSFRKGMEEVKEARTSGATESGVAMPRGESRGTNREPAKSHSGTGKPPQHSAEAAQTENLRPPHREPADGADAARAGTSGSAAVNRGWPASSERNPAQNDTGAGKQPQRQNQREEAAQRKHPGSRGHDPVLLGADHGLWRERPAEPGGRIRRDRAEAGPGRPASSARGAERPPGTKPEEGVPTRRLRSLGLEFGQPQDAVFQAERSGTRPSGANRAPQPRPAGAGRAAQRPQKPGQAGEPGELRWLRSMLHRSEDGSRGKEPIRDRVEREEGSRIRLAPKRREEMKLPLRAIGLEQEEDVVAIRRFFQRDPPHEPGAPQRKQEAGPKGAHGKGPHGKGPHGKVLYGKVRDGKGFDGKGRNGPPRNQSRTDAQNGPRAAGEQTRQARPARPRTDPPSPVIRPSPQQQASTATAPRVQRGKDPVADLASRADRFVSRWQELVRRRKALPGSNNAMVRGKIEQEMLRLAHGLERDPQLKAMLRSRAPELGLERLSGAD